MFPPNHNFLKAWLHNSIVFLNKVKQHLGPIERGAHQASYGGVSEDLAQKIQSRGYLYIKCDGGVVTHHHSHHKKKQIKKKYF